MSITLTLDKASQLAELPNLLDKIGVRYPLKMTFRRKLEPDGQRFKRMNALIRDICRHKHGRMTVTEREHEREVDRWKRSDAWPRYDDPEPNPDTGEVMYLPMSRADLDDDQLKGVCNWIQHYIDSNNIPQHGPVDNWQIPPAEGEA